MSEAKAEEAMKKVPGIKLPGEAEDKCCWCIPIKPGVIIIGVLMILWALSALLTFIDWIGVDGYLIYAILYLLCIAPIVLGAFFFVKYFMKMDDKERKEKLEKSCMLVILSSIIAFIISLLMVILGDNTFGNVISQLITSLIVAVIYLYYAGVCKRFAA